MGVASSVNAIENSIWELNSVEWRGGKDYNRLRWAGVKEGNRLNLAAAERRVGKWLFQQVGL